MRLLLDTHTLLWWAHEPLMLSADARDAIADGGNEVMVSAVSAMEIATKHRKGALAYRTSLAERFVDTVATQGFEVLSVSGEHAERAGGYGWSNQDPWDRLLAAQAQIDDLVLVTTDLALRDFAVRTLW